MAMLDQEVNKMLAQVARKLSLLDEFPPDEQAVHIKLQALALEVEVMEKVHLAAVARHRAAPMIDKSSINREVIAADENFAERFSEFLRVYDLVQDFLPHVRLLSSWVRYAQRYHEQVESKKSPIEIGGKK